MSKRERIRELEAENANLRAAILALNAHVQLGNAQAQAVLTKAIADVRLTVESNRLLLTGIAKYAASVGDDIIEHVREGIAEYQKVI